MRMKAPNGTVLAERVKTADRFFARFRGLMFQKRFPQAYDGLLIKPCNSVHTMFMRYTIDVLFLNADLTVLHICNRLRPWRVSPVIKRAACVLELKAGNVEECGIREGDMLMLEETRKVAG